ncbi:precorrin-2 dehydrogenase/sirohydrochlorin ferrochelatase family protein, partial [Ornithinicoccus halotolerans]|uniref:precorrin-2 dehydrogenase/sirohydrochlorin ferrochelatase family protein n=1 Tax=Ornithinicoccus halotolerans TaxID=1748220 RepID=UPI002B21F7D0
MSPATPDQTPLLLGLDLRDRLVTLVGGGAVTARRARMLLAAGARLRVVSPVLHPELAELAAGQSVDWLARRYRGAADLAGCWLVHTATGDPEADAQVARDAEAARLFCVQAGRAEEGSARVPAR